MSQDIHTHLEKLKTELNKLEPAVKHLQKADENATALISSLTNIHKEFSKHLQSIEKSLSDANEKHQKQLTKEIQESIKKITDATELFSKYNSTFDKQIKILLSEYSELGIASADLIKKIENVDFPKQFDELSTTLSSIKHELQKIQTKIGTLERNLNNTLQAKEDSLKDKIDCFEKTTKALLEKHLKENKTFKRLFFVSIGLAIAQIIHIIFLNR